jgi:DegV family protein with EDD domain
LGKIALVTDSTATIHQETLQEYGIHVAPLHITWDRTQYRDGIDIRPGDFYKRLRIANNLPTTSGAIIGEFLQIFESLRGKVDGVVTIVLSKDLSTVYNSAITAGHMISDMKIEVIDSRTSTMAMGFGVIAAAKTASGGGTMEQVIKSATDILNKVHLFFALDTLDYLRRGGRVNLPAAMIANFLQVKPILTLKHGKVEPVAKPRTKSGAVTALLDLMEKNITDSPLYVDVMHADDAEAAESLKNTIASRFNCKEILCTGFTPVMGTHTGPGCLGIAFYNE